MDLSATLEPTKARPMRAEARQAPVDRTHLARFTFGNAALEQEVLRLFADQAPQTLAWLKASAAGKEWRDAAHTLKGSARAVGAFEVAAAAEAAEAIAATLDATSRAAVLSRIESALEMACAYISHLERA